MDRKSLLLSGSEFEYLVGNKKLSKCFEYKIKSNVKKKISIFLENEFFLLLQSGLIDVNDLLAYLNNHMLLNLGKEKVRYDILILIHFVYLI